jgi:sulfite exporter TauE/SafE
MTARPAAALGVAIGGTAAGIGWLYLLRDAAALDAGPSVREALPLQRLAGGAAQPLLRLVIAWLPAGLIAGVLLAAAGYRRRAVRAAVMFALTLVLLLALGAMADAVTASERLGDHLTAQPGRAATWLAAALVAAGAAMPPGRRRG